MQFEINFSKLFIFTSHLSCDLLPSSHTYYLTTSPEFYFLQWFRPIASDKYTAWKLKTLMHEIRRNKLSKYSCIVVCHAKALRQIHKEAKIYCTDTTSLKNLLVKDKRNFSGTIISKLQKKYLAHSPLRFNRFTTPETESWEYCMTRENIFF